MGDSDDERDFKRRDKFHTERRGHGGHDGGDRFEERGGWRPRGGGFGRGGARGRPMYGGDFRGDRGFSPERGGGGRRHEMSPPPKRMRGGWGGEEDRYGGETGHWT